MFFVVIDVLATLSGATWWPAHPGTLAWVMLGFQVAACSSLALRRRAPLAVVAILGTFTLAITLLIWPAGALAPAHPDNIWAPYSTILAAYGPVLCCRDRRTAFTAIGLLAVAVARPWHATLLIISIGLVRTLLGPLLALYFEARQRLVQALRERAERAEREQHLLAEQARTEERARLAGEMHDVVTHRVSLMVLQAGALRMTAPDEATRQAAENLRVAGVQALDELRDLVGILRTEPEGDEAPSAADFAALVAESTAVGTPAELIEDGDPALASPVVGRTAFQVLREALTNVRKHAGEGATADVRLRFAGEGVELEIGSSGRVPARPSRRGLGLVGMRERAAASGGTLEAGPRSRGGYLVRAAIPVPPAVTR